VKIGELAGSAGVGVETIRYYERRGLLKEPDRTRAGYREYAEHDVLRMRFILRCKELGFSLSEIRDLLDALPSWSSRCSPAESSAVKTFCASSQM
jgi:DNA-binding transcriptional MerR regulator